VDSHSAGQEFFAFYGNRSFNTVLTICGN
jgi:hypothetical protein